MNAVEMPDRMAENLLMFNKAEQGQAAEETQDGGVQKAYKRRGILA
jgi:hypothetical protein